MKVVRTLVKSTLLCFQCVIAFQRPWRPSTETTNSLSRASLGERLTAAQRAQLHTVADLVLEVYKTLADMRYLDPLGIDTGPHEIDLDYCRQQNIGDSIVYLYQILPYINVSEAGQPGFVFGGQFSDFRDNDCIELSRDPLYSGWESCRSDCYSEDPSDQNLPYVAPWATRLTAMGNHEAVIFYDARADTVRVVDQLDDASRDPALKEVRTPSRRSMNRNAIDHIPSRPAADFLRDMVLWYQNLDLIPGDDIDNGIQAWEYDAMKALYQQAGWSDAFDGDAFEVSLARFQARDLAKHDMNQPLDQMQSHKRQVDSARYMIAKFQEHLETSVDEDDAWFARLDLWRWERDLADSLERLSQAEIDAKRLCPDEVCVKPVQLLSLEIENLRTELESAWGSEGYGLPRHHIKRRRILLRAWQEAEAEKRRAYVEDHGLVGARLERSRSSFQQDLVRLQEWYTMEAREVQELTEILLTRLPSTAVRTRQSVAVKIAKKEMNMERLSDDIWRLGKIASWPTPADFASMPDTCSVVWLEDR
ncbi:hypothetical protein Slin14017_G092340 [Septoria linicola]|nr:hypothetical protein Slin14017_G092340 [Septoria linicola]